MCRAALLLLLGSCTVLAVPVDPQHAAHCQATLASMSSSMSGSCPSSGSACGASCAALMVPFFEKCGDWVSASMPQLGPLSSACAQQKWGAHGCTDIPGWNDSGGETCADYVSRNYCANGAVAAGWTKALGSFSAWSVGGVDASQACCACKKHAVSSSPAVGTEASACPKTYLTTAVHNINSVCCRGNAKCNGAFGIPAQCSADCAPVFEEFYLRCRASPVFKASASANLMDTFVAKCRGSPAAPAPSPSGVPSSSPAVSGKMCARGDQCFLLRMQDQPGCTKGYTLHGLWAQWPGADTCTSETFDEQDLSSIMPLMKSLWPSCRMTNGVNHGVDSTFWTHEWTKHGTCAGLSQLKYFQTALDMAQEYRSQCPPDTDTAPTSKPMQCNICFAKDLKTVMPCAPAHSGSSGGGGYHHHHHHHGHSGGGPAGTTCVPGKHGPKCSSSADCAGVSGCVRCAHSGFCTNVALSGSR